MSDRYVTVGIDHGTTNSGIAVMEEDRPRVIKPNGLDDVMPSAVYIDKRGRLLVGDAARKATMTGQDGDGNGYTGYKTHIGQDGRYDFAAARKVMTAPELGAVVIGKLLEAYRDEMHHTPRACVITVPAKFEQNACDGTRQAARLAGLLYYPLLQEPVAASLAYGFNTRDARAQWMVFDLGGGTFDVSLVLVRDGRMTVPEEGNAGDTQLGGRNFDRELMTYVLGQLSRQYRLGGFSEHNPKYRSAWGRLMLAAEEAKIELSRRQETVVEVDGTLCQDERGSDVKVEVAVTRAQYEKMIAPAVERAVTICQMLLKRNRLAAKQLDRLILVGGPTNTPYLRRVLSERLDIPLDTRIDPMTAVAQGAALHATTVEVPEELRPLLVNVPPNADAPEVALRVEYGRVSKLPTHWVTGMVEGEAVSGGLSVEIRRSDGLWSSGTLPIEDGGLFSTEILLIDQKRPTLSRFTTTVFDRSGNILTSVAEPEIWFPYPDVTSRQATSLRVAVRGNHADLLIRQGAELPARGTGQYTSARDVRRGSSEDILRIPVLESVTTLLGTEDDHADCCVHVGTLVIAGSDERMTIDLPRGSAIDVTVMTDESREISVLAEVELLDAEFKATFKPEAYEFDIEQVAKRFETLKESLERARKLQAEQPSPEVQEALSIFERQDVIGDIEKDLERAKEGERDARLRAYRRVLELAGTMNQINEMQKEARIRQHIQELTRAVREEDKPHMREIEGDLAAAVSSKDPKAMTAVEQSLHEMDDKVRRQPFGELLLDLFALSGQHVTLQQNEAFQRAEALFKKIKEKGGMSAMTFEDIQQMEEMHRELMRLHPDLPRLRQRKIEELTMQGHIGDGIGAGVDLSDIIKAGVSL
jgi:molecular chaperone DnaK